MYSLFKGYWALWVVGRTRSSTRKCRPRHGGSPVIAVDIDVDIETHIHTHLDIDTVADTDVDIDVCLLVDGS